MSFTYQGDPGASITDAVRFRLGDTDEDFYFLEDEEIDWALLQYPSEADASAFLAESLGNKFAREPVSTNIGETNITYGDMAARMFDIAERTRNSARLSGAIPFWDNASAADPDMVSERTDTPDPSIS